MGEVVALRSDDDAIYRTARARAWASLTDDQRFYVKVVEANKDLFTLFDALERHYRSTGQFVVPFELGDFEHDAFIIMHRFADEVALLLAELREAKAFVDDFNYGQNQMPAY